MPLATERALFPLDAASEAGQGREAETAQCNSSKKAEKNYAPQKGPKEHTTDSPAA